MTKITTLHYVLAVVCGLVTATATVAEAQNWPTHPVTIVVPFAPGASNDLAARVIAQTMSKTLGQPFVVLNRPGAASLIGARYVSKAAPDGYTLLLTAHSIAALGLGTKEEFNAMTELTPIAMVYKNPQAMMVPTSIGVNTVSEFIDYVKKNPDNAFYGITDFGGLPHVHYEEFALLAGIKLKPVVYQSAAPMFIDTSQARLIVNFGSVNSGLSLISSGLLKVIAYTGEGATADSPKAPNIKDAGVNFEWISWSGIFGPPGMAPDLLKKINAALNEAMRSTEYIVMLDKAGSARVQTTPEEFAAAVKSSRERVLRLMEVTGVKPE